MGTGKATTVHADTMIARRQPLPHELALIEAGYQPTKVAWMGPTQPPKAWELAHDQALQVTAVNANWPHGIRAGRSVPPRIAENRPVPRHASCHYVNLDLTRSISSTYFY